MSYTVNKAGVCKEKALQKHRDTLFTLITRGYEETLSEVYNIMNSYMVDKPPRTSPLRDLIIMQVIRGTGMEQQKFIWQNQQFAEDRKKVTKREKYEEISDD